MEKDNLMNSLASIQPRRIPEYLSPYRVSETECLFSPLNAPEYRSLPHQYHQNAGILYPDSAHTKSTKIPVLSYCESLPDR